MEGPDLDEDGLAWVARDILCNEMLETWTLVPEENLKKNDRFHQERVKYDIPKWHSRGSNEVEKFVMGSASDADLEALSRKRNLGLSLPEMRAVRDYFEQPSVREKRLERGLTDPTDVELEVIARSWSEQSQQKIMNAKVTHAGGVVDGLFKTMIAQVGAQVSKPWLVPEVKNRPAILVFDDEDALCVQIEDHHASAALEPFGAALTGVLGVNRSILGCGVGAKPIFNTHVLCMAPPDYAPSLPDRVMHPRRILDGIRRGVEHASNKSGVPIINGALVLEDRFLGRPLVYCGGVGIMPRVVAGESCESRKVLVGDRICMVGGRVGKDGIHGAAFAALSLNEQAFSSVQLGDVVIQRRMHDFLLEARSLGLYRCLSENRAGGLALSVAALARVSGGATLDLSQIKTKYPGLKPFELVVSESQERMTVVVPTIQLEGFLSLAVRRGVEVSDLGEFNASGRWEIYEGAAIVGSLDLTFLEEGGPRLELEASWEPVASVRVEVPPSEDGLPSFKKLGHQLTLGLLGRPNIASKEWMIRQYDHEAQGTSVIKPLHTSGSGTTRSWSGPNDGAVVKPKANSDLGVAVGSGINPKLSDVDPFLMAQSAVDEAMRNVLCVGAQYGGPDAVLALVENISWSNPVGDPNQVGGLLRACQGLQEAAVELSTPLLTGMNSLHHDFKGKKNGQVVSFSVPPTILITALARVPDVKLARTSDFKAVGDHIYLLGHSDFGTLGSEFQKIISENPQLQVLAPAPRVGMPAWNIAKKVYSWLGGGLGKQQARLKSLHDVSDGGLIVAVAECLMSRGLGGSLWLPSGHNECGIPFQRVGMVEAHDRLEVFVKGADLGSAAGPYGNLAFSFTVNQLRSAWLKEGYWE
jgi:phosphoribosylformylglycinamidine synthase